MQGASSCRSLLLKACTCAACITVLLASEAQVCSRACSSWWPLRRLQSACMPAVAQKSKRPWPQGTKEEKKGESQPHLLRERGGVEQRTQDLQHALLQPALVPAQQRPAGAQRGEHVRPVPPHLSAAACLGLIRSPTCCLSLLHRTTSDMQRPACMHTTFIPEHYETRGRNHGAALGTVLT